VERILQITIIEGVRAVNFRWLIPSVLGYCVLSAITTQLATARSQPQLDLPDGSKLAQLKTQTPQKIAQFGPTGRLLSWRFNPARNQLEFRTSGGVQPQAQLLTDPTRLVIDLPGIILGRPPVTQTLSGSFRSMRVGQFDRLTARIVLELDPSHTLDPNQIRFRGPRPNYWLVQLSNPQNQGADSSPTEQSIPPSSSWPTVLRRSTPPSPPVAPLGADTSASAATGVTQIHNIRVTQDGFFIRTSGDEPQVDIQRSRDRRQVVLNFPNTTLSSGVPQRGMVIDRFGVKRAQVVQAATTPPSVRFTLWVDRKSLDWQSRFINAKDLNGIALLPANSPQLASLSNSPPPSRGRAGAVIRSSRFDTLRNSQFPTSSSVVAPTSGNVATIQAIELQEDAGQLSIRSDQPLVYTSGWDRATAAYRINLTAQLASGFRSPRTFGSRSVQRLLVRQETVNTVVILVAPAAGVQIGNLNQISPQELSLALTQSVAIAVPPPETISGSPGSNSQSIGVPPPLQQTIPVPPPINAYPASRLPRATSGRSVVVIDPGHGGPDPGAIGRGGIREKDIVMDISRQVARLLERQGVQAVLTRYDDRDLGLEPRVQIARRVNASIFVSIHANAISMSRPDINGLETFYYSSGESLARMVHRNVLRATGARDRRVRSARFYVLRRTDMPAILVETGYVTGWEDARRLATAAYRARVAEGIARGILQYLRG
jgi:N-acetylmuramoyl-L-alanine amidase